MNSRKQRRLRRPAHLLTVLLFPALLAGFASVGQAQEISNTVVTTKRPQSTDTSDEIREQLHEAIENTVGMTHIDVRSDLDLKLGRPTRAWRIATADRNNRG